MKILLVTAVAAASSTATIWLAAWLLLKDTSVLRPMRAVFYQVLLWIPVGLVVLVLAIPVGAQFEMPEHVRGLVSAYAVPLVIMEFITGALGVKWSYDRNLRVAAIMYGPAMALKITGYYILFTKKPELWNWLPPLS